MSLSTFHFNCNTNHFPNALPYLIEWWFCEADKNLPENLVGAAKLILKCEHGCVESNSSLTRHEA